MSEKIQELITLEPIEFKVTTESARQDVQTYGEIPEFDPSLGKTDPVNAQIIIGSKHFNKQVSAVEKLRKHFKEPSLTYGRAVDTTAKEITAIYEPAKLAWNTARKRIDDFEKIQEQKRIDAERERVENIGRAITALQMLISSCVGLNSIDLVAKYESVEIPTEEFYQERHNEAVEVYKDTMSKLESMISTAKGAEEVEKVRAEAEERHQAEKKALEEDAKREREEFEREKFEFQKEKDKLKAEQDAKDEAEALKKAEQEAKELAEQQEEADKKRQKSKETEYKIAEAEAITAIQYQLNEGGNAEDILEAIISEQIPHVQWLF